MFWKTSGDLYCPSVVGEGQGASLSFSNIIKIDLWGTFEVYMDGFKRPLSSNGRSGRSRDLLRCLLKLKMQDFCEISRDIKISYFYETSRDIKISYFYEISRDIKISYFMKHLEKARYLIFMRYLETSRYLIFMRYLEISRYLIFMRHLETSRYLIFMRHLEISRYLYLHVSICSYLLWAFIYCYKTSNFLRLQVIETLCLLLIWNFMCNLCVMAGVEK